MAESFGIFCVFVLVMALGVLSLISSAFGWITTNVGDLAGCVAKRSAWDWFWSQFEWEGVVSLIHFVIDLVRYWTGAGMPRE